MTKIDPSTFDLSSLRRLTITYSIAFAFIAFTLVASSVTMHYVIEQNGDDSRVINLSGRQRMLSQRMTKCVLSLERNVNVNEKYKRISELVDSFGSWKNVHQGLQFGDAGLGLPLRENTVEIKQLFVELGPYYQAITAAVESIILSYKSDKISNNDRYVAINNLLNNETAFLDLMDKITYQFDSEAKSKVSFIQSLEFILLAIGLLVLLLEYLLIFRPSFGYLIEALASINAATDSLKETTRELVLAKDQAEAASQSKTAFLASMSHELRTPLNAILGFAEIIRDDVKIASTKSRANEYASDIYDSGAYLLSLINDILDVAKIDAGKLEVEKEVFFVPDALMGVMRMVSLRAVRDGLTIRHHVENPANYIEADPRAIKQILFNLISNAIKYTDRDGKIDIAITRELDSFISITVSDTGKGIPENRLWSLGAPFEKVDNRYSESANGTGLGLSLVRGLVSLHNGSMTIESALGIGTKVTVKLPQGQIPDHLPV